MTERVRLDAAGRAALEAEVQEELEAGNWPPCAFGCDPWDSLVRYVGLVTDVPTFVCKRCSGLFSADLKDLKPPK